LYGALDGALARRVADEAHRQGLLVWSHAALIPARPGEVVAAGADVVSHAHLLALEAMPATTLELRNQLAYQPAVADHPAVRRLLAGMRERGVIFEPTLFVFRAGAAMPDTSRLFRMAQTAFAITRAAHAAGVRIAAGTDGMIGPEAGALPNLHTELELLVTHAGLTPMDALVAATHTNAEALGIADTHGTIAVGKAADLLVLDADPTADVANTRRIRFVVRAGTVVMP
jgi:imidazolonepropionase-like amidohydrolase